MKFLNYTRADKYMGTPKNSIFHTLVIGEPALQSPADNAFNRGMLNDEVIFRSAYVFLMAIVFQTFFYLICNFIKRSAS